MKRPRLHWLPEDPHTAARGESRLVGDDQTAHLRARIGTQTEDERLHALIGELSLKSDRFRQLWARHDVRTATSGTFLIRHPRVGDLELLVEKFSVVGTDGLEALFLHAEPGTRSADALATLASPVTAD